MKALLGLAVAVGIALFVWLHVAVRVMPEQNARDFVENIRLNLDNKKQGRSQSYGGPEGMPIARFTLPEKGIEQNFRIEETKNPKIWDGPESRALVWKVTFEASPLYPGKYPQTQVYRLVMVDSGSLMIPSYLPVEFFPWNHRRRR